MVDFRVGSATIYFVEARLERGRPWKRINGDGEWPPYKEEAKAERAVNKLKRDIPRKRR